MMAFTVEDFHDLIELLTQHPEWRAELRRHVLSDELIELPVLVRQLVDAVATLTSRVDSLVEAQIRTEERLAELALAQTRSDARLDRIVDRMGEMDGRLLDSTSAIFTMRVGFRGRSAARSAAYQEGWYPPAFHERRADHDAHESHRTALSGSGGLKQKWRKSRLELDFGRKGPAYLSPIARRLRVIESGPLADMLDDAVDERLLTGDERNAILRADVIMSGRRREDGESVYLAVEISGGVGTHDVERVATRATLLAKLGRPVLAVVAGRRIHDDAAALARALGVWTAEEGEVTPPPGA
jgi:hypothetical protein